MVMSDEYGDEVPQSSSQTVNVTTYAVGGNSEAVHDIVILLVVEEKVRGSIRFGVPVTEYFCKISH